jgi:hypothetical protein
MWAAWGRADAHLPGAPRAKLAETVVPVDGSSSVGVDVFVVGYRIHLVA